MAINPVKPNIETPQATYRDSKKPIKTTDLVHPQPAEGHLVHDSLVSIPKFWLKDIAYDIKAVKDGFNGKAKDHQTGRLNDVGLKVGGIGIATYLASQTTDPKMRVMEYIGLGTFLACMSLYPKIAINAPSRVVQGYDIGKQYIDDQGRKKSVFQDGNYIPFDMYRGEYTGEDLDIIGDRMGIPRGIKNRDELTKEQMRKIAIQNNTLWMLGAGFATPVMTALICCGLEQILSPAMEMLRNGLYNSRISHILNETKNMSININDISSNNLSRKVGKFLNSYKDKEISKEDLENLVKLISKETDENLTSGIRSDLEKMFRNSKQSFLLSSDLTGDLAQVISNASNGRNKATFNEIFNLTKEDIEQALKKSGSDGNYIKLDEIKNFKGELKKLFSAKIESHAGNKDALYMVQNNVIENISKFLQKTPSMFIGENEIKEVTDFAKIIGDFKSKEKVLDKCKLFKVEHSPETILARSYKKFENVIFDVLDIRYKDLKLMKESENFTKEILEKKIQALVSNEEKYTKAINRLAKVMSDTEISLHGKSETESLIKDLISAYENNYNNTAKRINNIGSGKFSETINKLIKENVNGELKNTVKSREDMFNIIDGVKEPFTPKGSNYGEKAVEVAEEMSKGVGSSKQMTINKIIDRIQGVENSQRRILHTLDYFKREIPQDEYGKHINETMKNILLQANSADHTLKLHTDNNPKYYQDLVKNGWETPLQKSTEDAIGKIGGIEQGDISKRFGKYFTRFIDIMGQNDIDYRKPDHKLGKAVKDFYHINSYTREQKFNLVAQDPISFFKKASKMRFENQKWLRTASSIGGAVLAGTIMTQFLFGKIKNPHNIQKQVNYDTNI